MFLYLYSTLVTEQYLYDMLKGIALKQYASAYFNVFQRKRRLGVFDNLFNYIILSR